MPREVPPSTWYNMLRYQIVPPVFLVFFTGAPLYLALVGRGETPSWSGVVAKSLGNPFAWSCLILFWLWAFVSLKVPSKVHLGPVTTFGYQPKYQDNGVLYYWASLIGYFIIQALYPSFSTKLYNNMPELLGACNIAALIFCSFLWFKGKFHIDHVGDKQESKPVLFEFYRGMELHPRILGVDVKQYTNCRIGMMAWQLLIIVFFMAGVEKQGFHAAALVNLILQSVYIAKFFWWETGYFNTLDIILDRAGYYICWGCLVWVPCFYTFSSYYLVAHRPVISMTIAILNGILGLGAILMNYRVDLEKQIFRANSNCTLWGKPANYIVATYRDFKGKLKDSKLLTSGCWGVARHFNYTFELLAAFSWCFPGIGLSIWPFSYFIFLTILLVHRTFRDEEKCSSKYGDSWDKYCKKVPYRILPGVF